MDNNDKKRQSYYWTKAWSNYESEINKISNLQKNPEKKSVHLPPKKWGEPVWEQVAHELVYVIGLLEEDPTYPKNWRKVFRVLRTYENLCRENLNER